MRTIQELREHIIIIIDYTPVHALHGEGEFREGGDCFLSGGQEGAPSLTESCRATTRREIGAIGAYKMVP